MSENGASMGHNSGHSFDSDDRRDRFFTHLNPIWALEQQRVELVAQMTKLKRQAKADGFEAYEINKALEIRKTEKPEMIDNQMARLMAVFRFMNQPVGYQFNFLDEDRTPDVERAFNEGLAQALRGETINNPFGQGTPQYGACEDGWREGQDRLGVAMQKRMEDELARQAEGEIAATNVEAAAPKKRGRPKGSTNKKNGKVTAPPAPPAEDDEHAAQKAEDAKAFEEPFPASA